MPLTESISLEQQLSIYRDVKHGSEPKPPFYMLVVLSTLIAGYGLVANSTAVVIGAMIVAPLMYPIIGIALSLVVNDSALFRDALIAEAIGVLLSVGLGFVVGKSTFGLEIGSEILARTQPSPYDILVALAAGLAGAYTLINPRMNGAMPGVAIAVSLVPPLAVTGICLALDRYDLASGAFLLFFANFLAIELVSIVVFLFAGFADLLEPYNQTSPSPFHSPTMRLLAHFLKHAALSLGLLLVLGFYLGSTFLKTVDERYFQKRLDTALRIKVQKRTGARLSELSYIREPGGKINVVAVVMTPQEYLSSDVAKLQDDIRDELTEPNINLIVRSIISRDSDSNGTIFLLDEEKLKRQMRSQLEDFLNEVTRILNAHLASLFGAYLDDVKLEENGKIRAIIASVRTPVAITPAQIVPIQEQLQTLDANIHLVIRSIITRDADANRYLYEAEEQDITKPLASEQLALHETLEDYLKKAVKKIMPGGSLLDFQYNETDGLIDLLAVIQAPQNFSSKQVRSLQSYLQKNVNKKIKLVVRSVVGTDMDDTGFLTPEPLNPQKHK